MLFYVIIHWVKWMTTLTPSTWSVCKFSSDCRERKCSGSRFMKEAWNFLYYNSFYCLFACSILMSFFVAFAPFFLLHSIFITHSSNRIPIVTTEYKLPFMKFIWFGGSNNDSIDLSVWKCNCNKVERTISDVSFFLTSPCVDE